MGKIRHIEFAGPDAERLRSFYGQLFGWATSCREVGGDRYYDIEMPGDLTAGIRHEPQGAAEVVAYVEVDDLEGSVQRAEALGAKVRIPPKALDAVRFALVEDPGGNPIGLIETVGEDHGGRAHP